MSNMNQQAAAESIAQSLATVIASTSDDQMSKECMRLMGARDEGELVQSLKAAVGAILAKAPAVEPLRNDPTSMEQDGLAERMQRGTRVNPRSQLDKELDSIAADMPVEDAEIDNEHEQPGEN